MKFKLLPLIFFIFCFAMINNASAQAPKRWTSTELHDAMKKLDFLGSALYFAAHPDDENTRLIAYLSNVVHANTAYLSLTRGDGGQNLVGPEIRELLGLIRTQELLAARRIDGGHQFFTRANDFGYSKHPDETFNIWDKDMVLEDAVWVIRQFQPDIIINRFDHRRAGRTHGHHTASAVIAMEAFEIAGDADIYPDMLSDVDTWQPKRLYYNTSWWRYGSRKAFAEVDKSNMVQVNVGTYMPKRGTSVPEVAAQSRSQHKSQGFGSSGSRGSQMEYCEIIKGNMPENAEDLFAGINTTWTRVDGGAPVGEMVETLINEFNFDQPSNSLHQLLKIRSAITALPNGYWRNIKLQEVNSIIEGVLGLFVEAVASETATTPGESTTIKLEVINRSDANIQLKSFSSKGTETANEVNHLLANNEGWSMELDPNIHPEVFLTNPYWLNKPASLGMFTVEEHFNQLIGSPETPPALNFTFNFDITDPVSGEHVEFKVDRPVVYKTTDPVAGEVYQPFELTPPVFANISESAYIFADNRSQAINIKVIAGKDSIAGKVTLCHPEGWKIEPEFYDFSMAQKGQESSFAFELQPPANQAEGLVSALVTMGDETYTKSRTLIEYDHIPTQTVFKESEAQVVRLDIKTAGRYVGYLMGAGDEIPAALQQIGYDVTILEDKDISLGGLSSFDAIILGVRAYNTIDRLSVYQPILMKYVEQGGTLIVQYNTHRRLKVPMDQIAPYPLTISRDRVTVEEAEVTILAPDHAVMTTPNAISSKDFEGWVQERGLYFPNEWDDNFTPILSSHDPGEPARDGGLLVAEYGKGHYIYTGYSWFRELPAGVPGAFRIFANLISLGNEPKP